MTEYRRSFSTKELTYPKSHVLGTFVNISSTILTISYFQNKLMNYR